MTRTHSGEEHGGRSGSVTHSVWCMNLALPLVAVEGTPGECGAAYGARAASLVVGNVAAYIDRFAAMAGLAPAEVRRAGGAFRQVTLDAQPRVAAMLDGLAEGA